MKANGWLHDEQGKTSTGRILLILHTIQNWVWIWLILIDAIQVPESDVLNLLIGSLDVTMFIVFGAWVIGPRSFQYLFPQIGAALSGAAGLIGRLRGTDRHREDDERDPAGV